MTETTEEKKLDWNAKLIRFFVDNPRLVWILIAAILIGGIYSLGTLRREGFPQVRPKIVLVQTLYPGAGASEVEGQVTKQIESAVKDVKDLKSTNSTSANSVSFVTISLNESADLDKSVQDIQTKVQAATADLPKDAEQPKVSTVSTGGPAFIFGITEKGADIQTTRKEAQKLSDELVNVAGVKSVKFVIDAPTRVVIAYNIDKLKQYNIALATLSQILTASNVTFPAGTLTVNEQEKNIVSVGAFSSLDAMKETIVGFDARTRRVVTLNDIAEVRQETSAKDSVERFGYIVDGKLQSVLGIMVSVEVTNDADIITTRQAILDSVAKQKSDGIIAKNVEIKPLFDQGKSTQQQIDEILGAAVGSKANWYLLGGLQLLFVAMLLFVNWRAALISALAIPFSLGFTFITLALFGIQLNTIVLFSLILVIGLIVDPAIVMVEAIQRYRDLRYPNREAVVESGRRYGAALFMAVFTTLLVFFPFAIVSGVFGQIIKYIPFTVIPALFASYFVPVAVLPALSRRLLKPKKGSDQKKIASEEEGLPRSARFVMKANAWILAKTYRGIMTLVVAFVLVALSISIAVTGRVSIVQFSAPEDTDTISVSTTLKKGLPFSERNTAAKQLEAVVAKESGVDHYYYFDQSRDGFFLYIGLKDPSDRKEADQKSKAIVKHLKGELTSTQYFTDVIVKEISSGTPESDYQLQTQLFDNDPKILEAAAKEVGTFLRKQDHVIRVDDGFSGNNAPELRIVLDRKKVQTASLSSFEIGTQLKSLIDETSVTKFDAPDGSGLQEVFLVNGTKPATLDAIKNLPLVSRTGTTYKVSDLANVEESTAVDAITATNGKRFATVRARLDDPKLTVQVQQKLDAFLTPEKVKALKLDSRDNKGDYADIAKSFQELFVALAVAIVMTYVVLVLQFGSFTLPAIMLFTVPLSLIGVFPALWATKSDLGFLELLGVTILVGIVENVAIFLIDYANQLKREKGMTSREAIIQASGVRFRPILLTKLVALGGLLPLAIESPFWRGLSVVIIAGIGLSGFFSLVVIPILYVWIEALREKVHRTKKA